MKNSSVSRENWIKQSFQQYHPAFHKLFFAYLGLPQKVFTTLLLLKGQKSYCPAEFSHILFYKNISLFLSVWKSYSGLYYTTKTLGGFFFAASQNMRCIRAIANTFIFSDSKKKEIAAVLKNVIFEIFWG